MMNEIHFRKIAKELLLEVKNVQSTVDLLDSGSTVPFISRYRKEMTGSMDEVFITKVRDRIEQLRELDKRRESIVKSIDEQGKMTDALMKQIMETETLASLEDVYLPYKPKRRTKASIAREKGLEPLALWILDQNSEEIEVESMKYIQLEKGVDTIKDALEGAKDIIAEIINENIEVRKTMRDTFKKSGIIYSRIMKGKETEGQKYKDYFEFSEPINTIPSHRLLALRRGENEGFLSIDIYPPEEETLGILDATFVKGNGASSELVKESIRDSYKRLLKPSMETEVRLYSKNNADTIAIKVFTENLKQLLMAAPLGQKKILAIDPGFRTGCKVVALNSEGDLLDYEVIFPNEPQKDTIKSASKLKYMIEKYGIEAIAIGNGTASRETESFVKSLFASSKIIIAMVNESGASIYSASDIAREEFPDKDVTVRGAVSIGRRLMDPLAELVKIDPKSIGVGQYQHDVDQNYLKKSLDDIVINCVNKVGVELNTASKELLAYVSGLGKQLAKNIVEYRNQNGAFPDRDALKKVPRMGEKAFEQAAGFLRIRNGNNILDASSVHPERYKLVEQMAKDINATIQDIMTKKEMRAKIDIKKYVTEEVGLPTLQDILQELARPGRDPRETFEAFSFEEKIKEISDIRVGMKLPGVITNLTDFGAFVDIGVHQDGLIHKSHISDTFVHDILEVVKLQQKVMVTVLEIDGPRKRISLSLKSDPFAGNINTHKTGSTTPIKKQTSETKTTHENQKTKPYNKKEESKPQQNKIETVNVKEDFQTKLDMLRKKFQK